MIMAMGNQTLEVVCSRRNLSDNSESKDSVSDTSFVGVLVFIFNIWLILDGIVGGFCLTGLVQQFATA